MKTARLCVLAAVLLGLAFNPAAATPPRDISRIAIEGNAAVATADILECLSRYPAVLGAAEATHSDDDFARMIEDTLRAGYKTVGFHECRIQVTQSGEQWKASIVEGPRILTGPIRIQSSTENVDWLQKSLASFQADAKKVIWTEGKPWNGELRLSNEQQAHLGECLTRLGVHPRLVTANIKLDSVQAPQSPTAVLVLNVSSSIKPTRLEGFKCLPSDRERIAAALADQGIVIGSPVDQDTPLRAQQILLETGEFDIVTSKIDTGYGLGDVFLNIQATRGEAPNADAQLARQKVLGFSKQANQLISGRQGLHLTTTMGAAMGNIWVVDDSFGIQIDKDSQEIARFVNDGDGDKAVIETKEGLRYPFSIPNLSFRFGVVTSDIEKKKINCQLGADFESHEKRTKWNRFDLDLVTLCILFPLAESRCEALPNGFVIQSPRGRLQLAKDGQFESLSVSGESDPNSIWLVEVIDRLPESLRSIEVGPQEQLAFSIPRGVFDQTKRDKVKFYVQRDGRDFASNWTFWLVHDTLKYQPDTSIYHLAKCFSISACGDKDALHSACERWLQNNEQGPFSLMAIAYCYGSAGDSQRSAKLSDQAMQMLAQGEHLRRDADKLLVQGSVIGDATRRVNARELHSLISQIASACGADANVQGMLKLTQPPAGESVDQWSFVVERIAPIMLQPSMQTLAGHIRAAATRTAALPKQP